MDYSKLKGRIREVFGTQERFAESLGISRCSLSNKLNNKSEWSKREMQVSCDLLGFDAKEIPIYFFCPNC